MRTAQNVVVLSVASDKKGVMEPAVVLYRQHVLWFSSFLERIKLVGAVLLMVLMTHFTAG